MKKFLSIVSVVLCVSFIFAGGVIFGFADEGEDAEPSYYISVAGGEAFSDAERAICAKAGTTVSLKAGVSATGREFYRWEVESPADLILDDAESAETSFVMPGENVVLRAVFILPGTVMPVGEYVERLKDVAENYKTLYVMGCFGAPLNAANKVRYINHHSFNADPERRAMINAATDDTFGFDCVCLLKGILWGWNGDTSHVYGGASYAVKGVPDVSADGMFSLCKEPSTDFENIEFGEALWMSGHIGIYIGEGLAVECTPKWDNRVQITACNRTVEGYNRRNWSKHGYLPYVDYAADSAVEGGEDSVFTVTFISSVDAGELAPQSVPYGAAATAIAPSAEGMVFIGWYSDDAFTSKYDFTTPVTGDLILYAKWRKESDPRDPDEPIVEGPEYASGDVNRDERINARDVTLLMKYLVGIVKEDFYLPLADVNADSKVNAKDVAALMRMLVGVSPAPGDPGEDAPDTDPEDSAPVESDTGSSEPPEDGGQPQQPPESGSESTTESDTVLAWG